MAALGALFRVSRWGMWSLPSRMLGPVLLVELLTVLLVTVDLARVTPEQWMRSGWVGLVLSLCGILHAEISLRVERVRRRVTDAAHISLNSVWIFAAALSISTGLASLSAILSCSYLYLRVWRPAKVPLYREVYTTATMLLATHAAVATYVYLEGVTPFEAGGPPLRFIPLVASLLAFTVVNTCLVVGIVVLSGSKTLLQVLRRGEDVLLEVAALCLGAIVALMLHISVGLILFVFPPLIVLHRAVLVRQLEQAATTDSKTGLLTAETWLRLADQRLQRAHRDSRTAALLLLDLDHFHAVNNNHGHLLGDEVLRTVGEALRESARDGDLIGRYGGEEFVIWLDRSGRDYGDSNVLRIVANRIRARIADLDIHVMTADGPLTLAQQTVSIGVAAFPADGEDLLSLLAAADQAMYLAKEGGRNRVRLCEDETTHPPLPEGGPRRPRRSTDD